MSKHLGNILEPMPLMEKHGADALRWYMLAGGSPWAARRIGDDVLEEVVRKVLLTYWNTASFFVLYANASAWTPGAAPVAELADRPLLDRWAIAELHATVLEVDAALENFDSARAGRRLAQFIDDLSNWYVRRSRRRFWDGDPAALSTLHECLEVVTRLMAPFTPFITEEVHRRLVVEVWPDLPDSVHLRDWPQVDGALVDATLLEQMTLVRRLVELGRSARAESKVRTRQPLARALVHAPGWRDLPQELKTHVIDELNVREVVSDDGSGAPMVVETTIKPNFRALGKRFGNQTQADRSGYRGRRPRDARGRDRRRPIGVHRGRRKRHRALRRRPGRDRNPDRGVGGGERRRAVGCPRPRTDRRPARGRIGPRGDPVRSGQHARPADSTSATVSSCGGRPQTTPWPVRCASTPAQSPARCSRSRLCEGRPDADITPHHEADLGLTVWLRVAGG